MRGLLARVARAIRHDCLVGPDDRLVLAVSGGSDSIALTWILHALAPDGGPALAGIVHVNHGLRGAESNADEAFCRALATRLDLPIVVANVDVAGLARERRASIEVVAREARYAVFDQALSTLNGTLLATGHTMDDQAETVMLRLLRGAGTRGLSGIRVRRGRLVRPLLECRREDLRAYLKARGEAWREDDSNADRAISRNRLRHELMPVLETIAPAGVRALARLAALAKDDESVLMEAAIKNRSALVLSSGEAGRVDVDAGALSLLAPPLARRLIRALAAEVAPAAHLAASHLEAVCRLAATDKPVGHLDLPGLAVDREGDRLTLKLTRGTAGARETHETAWPLRALNVPGSVDLPEAGLRIDVRLDTQISGANGTGDGAVQAGAVKLPLAVRNRRPGDRFRPLGAPGRRKLQDVFVDRKVPRMERDRVPVVVDADGRIVWVAGVTVAHDCRVTSPEDGVLILIQREQPEQRTAQ